MWTILTRGLKVLYSWLRYVGLVRALSRWSFICWMLSAELVCSGLDWEQGQACHRLGNVPNWGSCCADGTSPPLPAHHPSSPCPPFCNPNQTSSLGFIRSEQQKTSSPSPAPLRKHGSLDSWAVQLAIIGQRRTRMRGRWEGHCWIGIKRFQQQ